MKYKIITIISLILIIFISFISFAGIIKPNSNEKWRVAFYEGGQFDDYRSNFIQLLIALDDDKVIKLKNIPAKEDKLSFDDFSHFKDEQEVWNFLVDNYESEKVEFIKDGFYTAGWDEKKRPDIKKSFIDRANKKKDIHLALALGTWSGQDLKNNDHKVNTMVFSVSDPILSGILTDPKDSGIDHVHVTIDPDSQYNQIKLFHDTLKFKNLGIPYDNSNDTTRSYAGTEHALRLSSNSYFKITECYTKDDIPDIEKSEESLMTCIENLIRLGVDAIMIPKQNGASERNLKKIAEYAIKHNIMTMVSGTDQTGVKNGILLGLSVANFETSGKYEAEVFKKIISGIQPRKIPQIFHFTRKISLNKTTARLLTLRRISDHNQSVNC